MRHHPQVEAALYRHLLDNSAIPLIGSVLSGLLMGLMHIGSPQQGSVLIWFIALCAITVVRALLAKRCLARFEARGYVKSEAAFYALSTGLSGVVWGASGLFLWDATPLAMVATIMATHAMAMGGALTLGAYLPAFYAFTIPASAPLILVFALRGEMTDMVMAAYSATFLVMILVISKRLNQSLRDVWKLSFEKEGLLAELTKANDLQKSLANTDGLTGIANRRRFDEALAQELARMSRTQSPLSLLILDVDHFKAYNDTYGHVAGDDVLKQIALILATAFSRASDMAARYGGEEFAVIMPDTNEGGALRQAELVRSEVAKLNIRHAASPTAPHVTVSMGVFSVYTSQIQEPKELIARADACLYQAKAGGRNRLVSGHLKQASAQGTSNDKQSRGASVAEFEVFMFKDKAGGGLGSST